MSGFVYQINIDRVIVRGVDSDAISNVDLRPHIERAIARDLVNTRLPTNRVARGAVSLQVGRIAGHSADIVAAVAGGVAQAISGGIEHG
jgi:hypothetical protein